MSRPSGLLPIRAVLAVIGGLLLPAVGASGQEKPAPIRFAYESRIGGALPIVAFKKGFFQKQGVTVTGQVFTSGPAIYEALFLGSADVGTMGDTAALIALSKTDRFVIIASQATGEHRHRLIVKNDGPYRTLADLRGKKVAIKKGTSTYGGFLSALQAAGIEPAAIQVLDLPPETMPQALSAGSIEAFAASEPTPSQAELQGGRQMMTFGGMGNNYPILILARADLVRDRPEDTVAFLKGLLEGEVFLKHHPAEAGKIVEQATGLPVAVVQSAMARHDFTLRLDPSVQKSLVDIGTFLVSQKIITNLPPLDTFTNTGLLEKARSQ